MISKYDKIIKEYFDIKDKETRHVLLSINEADQNQVLSALMSKLYDNIVNKVDDIDFGTIPNSKGDITQVENYDKIINCISLIQQILKEYRQDTKPIDIIEEAVGNIRARKEQFEKGFRYNLEFIMITYSTMTLSVISSLSFLISTCIDFIKSPSQDDFTISLNNTALIKTKQNLLFTNLQKFNNICNSGDLDRSLDFVVKNNLKQLTGAEITFVVAGIAITGIILNILPILRELIFFFYYSRTRVSDYFDIQADLLQMNAYNLQNNSNTTMSKTDKARIVKKQLSIVDFFRKVSNKVAINTKQSEVTATKELVLDKPVYKTNELMDSMPDSAAAKSLF